MSQRGGIAAKASRYPLAVLSVLILLSAVPIRTTAIDLPGGHCSIDVPAGWVPHVNYRYGGVLFALVLEGPITEGFRPIGLVQIVLWPGKVSSGTLYSALQDAIDELNTSGMMSDIVIVSEAQNMTLNNVTACDITLKGEVTATEVRERVVLAASADWKLAWEIVFSALDSIYDSFAYVIDSTIHSFKVETKERSGDLSKPVIAVAGTVIVCTVATLVLVLAMRSRKKREGLTPQLVQSNLPPPPPFNPPGAP